MARFAFYFKSGLFFLEKFSVGSLKDIIGGNVVKIGKLNENLGGYIKLTTLVIAVNTLTAG